MSDPLSAALAAYIPRDRAAQILTGAPLAGEGAALIADVSGFTPLTEALAQALNPARGAEALTGALNSIFAPLIDAAHAYGGSVIKFGGDALIIWFGRLPRTRRAAVLRRAVAAAHAMQAAVAAHGRVSTSAGTFTLTMKVGLAYGPVARLRLGDAAHGYEDVIGGATLDRMAEAEHHARPGEVLINPTDLPELASVAPVRELRDGFAVLGPPHGHVRREPQREAPAPAVTQSRQLLAELRPYVPAEVAEALAAGRAHPAELKPVVSIFVQFAGVKYEDAAAAEAQLAAYFGAAQRAAARYGGRVNRLITGDKGSVLHLIFGAPRALEELEERAARCAIELRGLAEAMPFIEAQRVGLAAGRAFSGPVGAPARYDYTVMGDAINLSSRLMQRAAPGQILIDPTLAVRLGPGFSLRSLGPAQLKGKVAPVELFALEGAAESAQSATPLGRVFGREAELGQLRERLAALATGRGGAVVLLGELGMGKSHLLAALRQEGGAGWVQASAPAYGGRPGGALIGAALGGLLGLGPGAGYTELEAACAALLGQRGGTAAAPYLARLLGLPLDPQREAELAALAGESLRWRLRELAGELAVAVAARGPIVLAFDDLQWADSTSLELIEAMLPAVEAAPLLIIAAARPESETRAWPLLGRMRAAGAPWLELGPLAAADAHALLRHHGPGLPAATLARLAERGGGNPLFLVELARAAAAAGPEAELPDSVQGLLLAQIDRLPGALRETLQRAALLGRAPDPQVLAELDSPVGLEARLAALAGAGFMLREGHGHGYAFRHILVQESAYGALLYERRRAGHTQAATAIEQLYPTQIAERSAELAGHYERAGQLLAAARYHGQAADAARLLYANAEAEAGYRHVLALLDQAEGDEGLRGRTLLKLAQVRMNAGDYAAAQELYDQAFEVMERAEAAEGPRRRRKAPLFRMGEYEPRTLDPGMSSILPEEVLARELFEGLVTVDSDLNVIPAAARRWRVEDGGRRYIFELREGLRWSDGAPLTAYDFVFAWRRNLNPETGAQLASQLYPIVGAEAMHTGAGEPGPLGVRASDDRVLEIELERPSGHFLYVLSAPIAFPQPAHLVSRYGNDWCRPGIFAGNGRFALASWRPQHHLGLVRNPHYYRCTGDLEAVQIYFGAPADDIAQQGRLDIVRCENSLDLAERHPGIAVTVQYLNTYLLGFACDRPPFASAALRRAFALAIDRDRLSRDVWHGVQQPARGGVVPPGIPGHSPDISLPFDPEAARAALSAAGRPPFNITLAVLPGMGGTPEFLRESWREHLGITVQIASDVPVDELLAGLSGGKYQMAVFGWDLDFPEPADILHTLFYGDSPINCFGWRDPRFDALIDEAIALEAAQARLARFHAADRLLIAEAVAVPLYHSRTLVLLRPGYALADDVRVVRGGRLRLDQIVRTGPRRAGRGALRSVS